MTGKKIKFALKLKEGVEARNLQELKEAFDLNQIIAYFLDGKLETWLLDRYYNDLAEKIGTLEKTDPELRRKLCEIFEVEYEEDSLSVEEIEKRSQRIRKLKEITDDETIIRHVDKVAFSQEELADLLDSGQETIYLCGTGFHIPVNKKGIRYIGIETKLDITEEERENYEANDIELIDLFNDYSEETKDEYKKRIRFGEIFLDTDENQDSTQESNNCVPEEGQQQAAATDNTDNAATEHDVVDELVEYQTKLKAAKQTCESDIILNMSESSYLAMKALGFDYAVYKVMTRPADEKDKGDYRLNFSKAKRVLKLIVDYKHLPNVQGKFTDEQYANEMMFTKENLLVIMGENKFDDPEIELIIHEISHYYMDKAAENSTVTDEEVTATNTGEDTSDEEDFMEVHDNDDYSAVNEFGAKLQKAVVTYDDDIKLTVPEELYKMAEGIGLVDDTIHLIETVNDTKLFNLSQYKRSWEAIYEAIKVGLRQIMPEKTINTYEERIKHIISTILKGNGYDENGNRLAGYAVNNNAPRTVNESAAPYGVNDTSSVVNGPVATPPVQEDFGVFAPDKSESRSVPGITITLNGNKVFLPREKYFPYRMFSIVKLVLTNEVCKELGEIARCDAMINGNNVTGLDAFMHDNNDVYLKYTKM